MMHHLSSSSQGHHVMGHCTCGMFHGQNNNSSSSFSMLFSKPYDETVDNTYCFTSSSSSTSSVDCTLSLGTPSTRLCEDEEKRNRCSVKNFCWDLLTPKQYNSVQSQTKVTRGNGNNNNNNNNNDSLLARRCANCDTTSTPLWRNGPRGPKSLCNACGIRFKKEERRATAAATTPPTAATIGVMEPTPMYNNNNSWYVHPQNQKMQCFSPAMSNEFRFIDETDRDSENGIPFLSWRLNVTDRTSFVHDFTR